MSASSASGWLSDISAINQQIVGAQYAVRGPIPARAEEIKKAQQLNKSGVSSKKVIECNIGNPQAIGNPYLTFPRDVLSAFTAPHLLERPDARDFFKEDVIARAKGYLTALGHSGGYTLSGGAPIVRQNVAKYIERRDQLPVGTVYTEDIFLTDGASRGVHNTLAFIRNSPSDGVMVPVPQYPLYSATLHTLDMRMVPYYLDERQNWSLDMKSLEGAYKKASADGTNVKAIVIINPGNPTGQVLSKESVCEVVDFARRRGLTILADEVYQENVYTDAKKFYSLHRGLRETPLPAGAKADVPLFSFHSTSKGIIGECGRRGGYTHIVNLDRNNILPVYNKLASIMLCSNLTGQITTDLMVNPPRLGDASYEQYSAEYNSIMSSYKRRAKVLVDGLRAIPGIWSNEIEGAMYAFPSLKLPERYIEAASKAGMHADFKWCLELLESEHVVVVPGSGFEQEPGTFHFRTTILPREEEMVEVVERIKRHHTRVMQEYGGNPSKL